MNNIFTQDFTALEEEATSLLLVFEKLPDSLFTNIGVAPGNFYINNVKNFARAYKPMGPGNRDGIVLN